MKDRTIRLGIWLKKQGINTGDIIVVCTDNHLDSYIPILSTFYAGAIYNPWQVELTMSKYYIVKKKIVNYSLVKLRFS